MTDNPSPRLVQVRPTLQGSNKDVSTIKHRTQAPFGFLILMIVVVVLILVLTTKLAGADFAPLRPADTHSAFPPMASLTVTSAITPTNEWVNFYS